MISHFDLSTPAIHAICARTLDGAQPPSSARLGTESLWDACRAQSRVKLDDLAQRIHSTVTWDDLVLPERTMTLLREIPVHVRHRARVYEAWGFAAKSSRGLGISAMFAAPAAPARPWPPKCSPTNCELDLYRIDLSQVVSKYIGETEKNLRRVFDAAEEGGAMLLFDEADALFGKRSEVKDSHDRYANIEVSYLLQRMEAYRGLAILTTNMKSALDPAFMRRIRFVVQFPFPDAAQRAEIWQRVFPEATPTDGLDAARLRAPERRWRQHSQHRPERGVPRRGSRRTGAHAPPVCAPRAPNSPSSKNRSRRRSWKDGNEEANPVDWHRKEPGWDEAP